MFALIIGIDDYSHAPKLKGAVADASRFESFLLDQVKVKSNRIITLHNKKARRKAIADAFRDLCKRESIQRDDPILIFYAGHGCEMPSPKGWDTGGQEKIQAICPCDMTRGDSSSQAIHPIPDRTIAIWLNDLSYNKGHNITVIFDCCHSAGITRAQKEGERYVQFEGPFPLALEREYAEDLKRMERISSSYANLHSRSHVLLAACGAAESAREEDGKGIFTTELLRALKQPGVEELSFLEFMRNLQDLTMKKKTPQTPQCYGHFKDRILFRNLLKLGSGVFPAIWEPQTKTYRIEAGLIHGVDKGSIFEMHEDATISETMGRKLLCTLTARKVDPLFTFADINEDKVKSPGAPGVVRQVCSGNPLKVHFTASFLAVVNRNEVLRPHDIHRKVKVEDDAKKADFTVDVKDKKAVFTTGLKVMTAHGFRGLPKDVPANLESVHRVLIAASRLKQHLEISCDSSWSEKIHIDFFRITEGKKLNAGDDLVYLDIRPGNNDLYGMKIHNETQRNLHCSMLAFDMGDLDINCIVTGSIGVQHTGDADPNLHSMKQLPIGFGNGGTARLKFQYLTVTVLKLYFTTDPMDFKWLEQATPFPDNMQETRGMADKERAWRALNASTRKVFTKLFTIVQSPNLAR